MQSVFPAIRFATVCAVALSPTLIIGLIAIGFAERGKAKATSYVIGAFFGTLLVSLLSALFASSIHGAADPASKRLISIIVSGLLILLFAWFAWSSLRSRPKHGAVASAPKWMAALGKLNLISAAGIGLLLSVLNGKNLPILMQSGIHAAHSDTSPLMLVLWALVFAALCSLLLVLLVVLLSLPGQQLQAALTDVKNVMMRENWLIMTILFSALLLAQLGNLSSALAH